jgi:hypothetical protein
MRIQASRGDAMRGLVRLIVATGMVLAASPASAQRYDPAYPVCKEVVDGEGARMECFFTSMAQCKEGQGTPGTCLTNPYYKPPPPEPTPVAEPAPTPTPTPAKKKKKS